MQKQNAAFKKNLIHSKTYRFSASYHAYELWPSLHAEEYIVHHDGNNW